MGCGEFNFQQFKERMLIGSLFRAWGKCIGGSDLLDVYSIQSYTVVLL